MFKRKPPLEPWSHDFRHVLNEELNHIGEKGGQATDPIARAHEKQLVGLAFSGGGIRSATFNLGVLQALARLRLLGKFHYLSTVSGGGYIGSWLIAWIKRRGVKDVREGLRPERKRQPGRSEPEEIHFLRRFSNYLTPKLGWLGADMWTVVAIYIRNLILNLIILGAAFACVLLAPRWMAIGSKLAWQTFSFRFLAFIALAALFAATVAIVRSMRYFGMNSAAKRSGTETLSELERRTGWRDQEGQVVQLPLPEAPAAWYSEELFDDFILRLQFKITGPSHAQVFVWTPWAEADHRPLSATARGAIVHVACAGLKCAATGAINEQAPVRDAAVKPGTNTLEITCVNDRCTVRINEETINTARVERLKQPRSSFFGRSQTLPGAIGIEKGGVHIANVEVQRIQTAWSTGATQGQVQRRIIGPLFLAAFLAAMFLFGFGDYSNSQVDGTSLSAVPMLQWVGQLPLQEVWSWWTAGLVAGAVSTLLVFAARLLSAIRRGQNLTEEVIQILPATVGIFVAAGIGGVISRGLYDLFFLKTVWSVLVWGPPAMLAAFLATTILLIGLMGRSLPDERREWWSRLSAWLVIYGLAWIAIFGVAFYAPPLVRYALLQAPVWLSAISVTWVASTVMGLIAAKSAASGRQNSNALLEFLAKTAPYVFVAGFLVLLSWSIDTLVSGRSPRPSEAATDTFGAIVSNQWTVMYHTCGPAMEWLFWVTVACFLVAAVLSLRLDINQFSMHLLYRNRLGRCYLGASNRLRRAQPFTGFSADDDILLSELANLTFDGTLAAPYPIINAALNLVGGKELAWQQRKAASFVFTPRFCGYEFPELPPGFCATDQFASVPSPVTLATAMAISGAAASPNMGYHTSAAPAFLMTVFNVRLGWWLGNPRQVRGYQRSGPLNVLWSLICELFGLTSDERKYIYLSDGGHFENLGIYELVRRRCRFIIACDAEEDHTFGFGGLGNAIEKCRSDFGVDIDIDVEPIRRRSEKGHSDWHCAIGKIHYSRVDRGARDGILVYLKTSLTGDEPTDVLRYAAANPGFPHQSTGDQWFDESQFESYRVLGFHVAENVFRAVGDASTLATLSTEQMFVDLTQAWYPPSVATADAFTKHTRTIVAIYDQLRGNEDLKFLSEYIYPEWRVLFETLNEAASTSPSSFALDTKKSFRDQLPKREAELRAGFYVCNSVFQLFEDAYVDLNLEDEFDHPDNRGWMNFFKHWSWVPMLRVAWTISAGNYGARFQRFCDRHLGLTIGEIDVRPIFWGGEIDLRVPDVTVIWSGNTEKAARRIVDAIWTWLSTLPIGSNVIAEAAGTANEKSPFSKFDPTITEEQALQKARTLIEEALRRKRRKRIARRAPSRKDEEWYAAATLWELARRRNVEAECEIAYANTVAELALAHGSIIMERISQGDFEREFNSIERELIEGFLVFNPSLAATAVIKRLEITPDPKARRATSADRRLHFPFGFAILAKTELPGHGVPDPPPTRNARLVYFRVQDHVRRMGLARETLKEMMQPEEPVEIDLRPMDPNACEVPTEKDRARFGRLYQSVKNEVRQKAAPRSR